MTTFLALAAVSLALLAPLIVTAVRHRTLVAMTMRNIGRRRSEALLVVAGAMLGTAIITSSFVVGDLVGAAGRDAARTQLGPIDLTVTAAHDATPGTGDDLLATIRAAGIDGIDGLLATRTATVTLSSTNQAATFPQVQVAELDLDAARTFGTDPSLTGLADAPTLRPGEILLNEGAAERLMAQPGDTVELHAWGERTLLQVVEVVPEVGLAGHTGAIVAPGVLASLAESRTATAAPPQERVLVSLEGGVFDTRGASDDAASSIAAAVGHLPGTQVEATKAILLDAADTTGAAFTELFGALGVFSVIAGILLLVNLFVMLAEERKTELGMLRALGFTQRRLSRAFALEGAAYALLASAIGAVVGVGIGWLVAVTADAFGLVDSGGPIGLVVEPASVGTGAMIGLTISLVTVWVTSVRISRLTIVRAIRDLPEPRVARTRTLVVGVVGMVAGTAMSFAGYLGGDAALLLVGVPVAAFSATPVLRRLLSDGVARVLGAGTALAWGLAVSPLFPDIMNYSHVGVFVLHMSVLTVGAVATAASLDRGWIRAVGGWRGRRGLAVRIGIVYSRARGARTATLMGMFTLVVLTITLISSVSATFESNTDRMVDQVAAGYDVRLDTSPANPVGAAALEARDDVAGVAPLRLGVASVATDHLDEPRSRVVSTFDERLLAIRSPGLLERAAAYPTDADVHRAVLADPSLAIVPVGYLDTGGPESVVTPLAVGDTLTLTSRDRSRVVTIVGMRDVDWTGDGAMVHAEVVDDLLGAQAVASRAYVATADGVDADELAGRLDHDLLAHGAQAASFAALGAEAISQDQAAMTLVGSFLALGLLVGIAAMSVVMARAVRERRQAIGVLRAIGIGREVVRTAMLSEAGLIAVQGTLIGAVFGVVAARQLLQTGGAFVDADIVFVTPWAALLVIVAVPLVTVLAATAWPAARAAATRPAVAMRTAE
jgi:putative ABC transport system permease protein